MASDHTNDDILICYHLSFVLCVVIRSSSVSAGGGGSLSFVLFCLYSIRFHVLCRLRCVYPFRTTYNACTGGISIFLSRISFSLPLLLYFCCSFSFSHHHLIVVDCLVCVHFKWLPLSSNFDRLFPSRTWASSVRGYHWPWTYLTGGVLGAHWISTTANRSLR